MLTNKGVSITGGTGSFGKKFTEIILKRYPDIRRLVIFSRDEMKQFEMEQTYSRSKFSCIRYFIGDVRDKERFKRACDGIDIIIHAAAPINLYGATKLVSDKLFIAANNIKAKRDLRVEPGFCYNSHDNAEWLSEIELRTLITNHIDPNFKPN